MQIGGVLHGRPWVCDGLCICDRIDLKTCADPFAVSILPKPDKRSVGSISRVMIIRYG
ncbi:hypothetical protein PSYPI_30121 [Pseudomonas syringae pv. pisi str. 1704B]|uniref:Uncharacterized protein n=2 Tax=Pseudomonas syringae group TaxID=136849 RepID=F3GGY4_PSESJ|nr:hypothetical protein PSYPI_30121 [Pseudomonas syringae pv. pisi str. 1704B]